MVEGRSTAAGVSGAGTYVVTPSTKRKGLVLSAPRIWQQTPGRQLQFSQVGTLQIAASAITIPTKKPTKKRIPQRRQEFCRHFLIMSNIIYNH